MPMAKKKSHERIAAIGTGNVSPGQTWLQGFVKRDYTGGAP